MYKLKFQLKISLFIGFYALQLFKFRFSGKPLELIPKIYIDYTMLHKHFFEIEDMSAVENELVTHISFKSDHVIFAGHFPGNPVMPGVMHIQVVKEILEAYLQKKLQLSTMTRCKFLHVLNPAATNELEVKIRIRESGNTVEVGASGKKNEIAFFKFNAIYQYQ